LVILHLTFSALVGNPASRRGCALSANHLLLCGVKLSEFGFVGLKERMDCCLPIRKESHLGLWHTERNMLSPFSLHVGAAHSHLTTTQPVVVPFGQQPCTVLLLVGVLHSNLTTAQLVVVPFRPTTLYCVVLNL